MPKLLNYNYNYIFEIYNYCRMLYRKKGLETLPPLSESLESLDCAENNLTVLPELPNTLRSLECGENKLSGLPQLPTILTKLECSSNLLTGLPELPESLETLDCAGNELTVLPQLPKTLISLECDYNKLTSLPELPQSLTHLICANNLLTTLPELPEYLEYLECDENNFEEPYKTFVDDYFNSIKHDLSDESEMIEAIDILRENIRNHRNPPLLWKGFTQSDISKFDIVFEEQASEYALCPVCLRFVERSEACMYMKHNCTDTPGFYHKGLYQRFKNKEGYIGWCTICGRISKGHSHYQYSPYTARLVLISGGDPFEKDCRISSGGGGLPEKLARFRRFREYALELQEDIDSKPKVTALEELVEEVLNAPLRKEKKLLTKIQEGKKWNINIGNFPKNVVANVVVNVNAPNIPFTGKLPTMLNKGRNNVMMMDDVPVLQFEHAQKDGTTKTHSVSKETLDGFIEGATTNFGEESFGFCFMYPACNSRLHPQEIHTHIPEELYTNYKKKFNIKFKTMVGGGNVFIEMDDAVCVTAKGGRRKTLKKNRRTKNKSRRKPAV